MLGAILQELRKDKGLKQAELAKIVGVATSSIGSYEAQLVDPPLDMLIKLADYFGVTLDYLVGRSRTCIDWDHLMTGFRVGEKLITLDDIADMVNRMGPNQRQAFFLVGDSLVQTSDHNENE